MTATAPLSALDLQECHSLVLDALTQRDRTRAMTLLTYIIKHWPSLTGKYCGLIASILYHQGQLDIAERLYRDAVEFDTDDVTARLHLGIVLQRLGRSAEAREQWDYIAQHHSERPEAFFQGALTAFFNQEYAAAEQAAQETLELLLPTHPLFEEARKVLLVAQAARRVAKGDEGVSLASTDHNK